LQWHEDASSQQKQHCCSMRLTPSCQLIPSADGRFVLQDWAIAAHCFAQAKDWLRHAACKANHMLYSKSGQDLEAAVLLVEAAAGAAKRHKQLTTGGSDGLTPIEADDYNAWLHTAALIYEQRLDRLAEALALYCQVRHI
jgi:hypothetical protein